jgi:hypothetical protein
MSSLFKSNKLRIIGASVLLVASLTACSGNNSEPDLASEFASFEYELHARDCGLDQLYDVQQYTSISSLKFFYKTTDFKLVDKYPDVLDYDSSMDSWSYYLADETAPYEQERENTLKCQTWLNSLDINKPADSNFDTAWKVFTESISSLKTVIDSRVLLLDEMYQLLPYSAKDKTQRDNYFGIISKYRAGERIAYKSHVAIRQILESAKFNDLDYWIATCPTFIQVTDLYGQIVTSSENGAISIWNNTESQGNFSGTAHFFNADGVEVASQSIDVTIPAGKSFEQSLEAVEGNDDYSGLRYPVTCTFTG